MGKIKNVMAYTNPIAIAMGIPVIVGMFLAVLGFRVGKIGINSLEVSNV